MGNLPSDQVRKFYDEEGWHLNGEHYQDAQDSEDLREVAKEYVSLCRQRVTRYLPENGEMILDMASGPIQYEEYLEYSRGFDKRVCVDLSEVALAAAEKKIGEHGAYICGDFNELSIPSNSFDAAVSLHTIYHIDATKQAQTVRKLISVVKPGGTIVIVYSNPRTLIRILSWPVRLLRDLSVQRADSLYFFRFPLTWWNQFTDEAVVAIYPWRALNSRHQKLLVPDNFFGKLLLRGIYKFEENFPRLAVRLFEYPMIVMKKR